MNNQVIFAAAGNGKTYSLCSKAKAAVEHGNKYVLLISYTNEGIRSLENEYRKQNSGILDDKVIFKSWYSFLLSDFIKPYQCSLKLKEKHGKQEISFSFPENFVSSIAFYSAELPPRWYNQSHLQYFVNQRGDITPDRASHLAYLCNDHSDGRALSRMEEIYSHIFIDELQDYAGWDLEIIRLLFESQIFITCVGDYKQAMMLFQGRQRKSVQDFSLCQHRSGQTKSAWQRSPCCVSTSSITARPEMCMLLTGKPGILRSSIYCSRVTFIGADELATFGLIRILSIFSSVS